MGSSVLEVVPLGTVLEVKQIQGTWLGVAGARQRFGWIDQREVRSLKAHLDALNSKGDDAWNQGDNGKARTIYEEVLALDPHNAHATLHHADTYFNEKDYRKAIDGYNKAIEIDPGNAAAYRWRGDAWSNLQEFKLALADYDKGLELSANDWETLLERADTLRKAGQSDKAIVELTLVIHAGAESIRSDAHIARALAWLAQNDVEAARSDILLAAHHKSTAAEGWRSAAWVFATHPDERLRDGTLAAEFALKACNLTQYKDSECLTALAAAYAETAQFPAAVMFQSKAVQFARNDEKSDYESRLELFKNRQPFRDTELTR